MISTAQTSADPSWQELSSLSLRESLLTAIDAACDDMADGKWLTGPNAIKQYKIFKAIESAIAADLGRPIYSEELASRVGLSIRTLQNAVQRYRGMSLHKYLRLRRLWLVRQQLLAGTTSVKIAALTFGFWHLSDFSRGYRALFGELPSETPARARDDVYSLGYGKNFRAPRHCLPRRRQHSLRPQQTRGARVRSRPTRTIARTSRRRR